MIKNTNSIKKAVETLFYHKVGDAFPKVVLDKQSNKAIIKAEAWFLVSSTDKIANATKLDPTQNKPQYAVTALRQSIALSPSLRALMAKK